VVLSVTIRDIVEADRGKERGEQNGQFERNDRKRGQRI